MRSQPPVAELIYNKVQIVEETSLYLTCSNIDRSNQRTGKVLRESHNRDVVSVSSLKTSQ